MVIILFFLQELKSQFELNILPVGVTAFAESYI